MIICRLKNLEVLCAQVILTSVNISSVISLLYIRRYPHIKFKSKVVFCDSSCISEQASQLTHIVRCPCFKLSVADFLFCL
jgi:hypothetical protein